MKTYELLLVEDGRPLDDWGKPVGTSYEKKDWNQLTPHEMMADFEWKSDILAAFGEEVSSATFYQDYLFEGLYDGTIEGDYKVLLTEYDAEESNKVHKIDVDDIENYLHLNDVALSPCLFYGNWRMKKLMNYVGAFVLDIDKLRPKQLRRFFMLFEEKRLLTPTFIVNSGSGVHFYYMLDKMLKVDSGYNEANNLIAEEIYNNLYNDVIKKEKWKDAQRHWIGQDYRVVNSKTKLNLTSQAFRVGEVYTIEQLIEYYDIKIDRKKNYASKAMIKYAGNIAKNLKIDPPDYSDAKETYEFIKKNKDEDYQIRQKKRELREKKSKWRKNKTYKPITWYKKTLAYMQDHTQAGYRFSSMKALAIIAFKEKVPRDIFVKDIDELGEYWSGYDWKGDDFNAKNIEAIKRFFDNAVKYSNTTSETLEEWLGYEFKRIPVKRNGLSQKDHLEVARGIQAIKNKQQGKNWRDGNGRKSKATIVKEWREANPDGKKAECIRKTGLSKPTVYKWWHGEEAYHRLKEMEKKTSFEIIEETAGEESVEFENDMQQTAAEMLAAQLLMLPEEERKKILLQLYKEELSEKNNRLG